MHFYFQKNFIFYLFIYILLNIAFAAFAPGAVFMTVFFSFFCDWIWILRCLLPKFIDNKWTKYAIHTFLVSVKEENWCWSPRWYGASRYTNVIRFSSHKVSQTQTFKYVQINKRFARTICNLAYRNIYNIVYNVCNLPFQRLRAAFPRK